MIQSRLSCILSLAQRRYASQLSSRRNAFAMQRTVSGRPQQQDLASDILFSQFRPLPAMRPRNAIVLSMAKSFQQQVPAAVQVEVIHGDDGQPGSQAVSVDDDDEEYVMIDAADGHHGDDAFVQLDAEDEDKLMEVSMNLFEKLQQSSDNQLDFTASNNNNADQSLKRLSLGASSLANAPSCKLLLENYELSKWNVEKQNGSWLSESYDNAEDGERLSYQYPSDQSVVYRADSVLKKRRKKMNKHKYKKRLKQTRAQRRRKASKKEDQSGGDSA
ncbi:hypothetical protein MP228_007191 [Amoeboaphelidium protococcarum]|nr:hypothetical protein MP228_007191 [Amoeboaphelidium protococcarum]